VRIGVVVLPQLRWREAAARWRAVEEMGFDHAWTYDHLAWRDLADEPWFGTVPTLTAAATVTSTIRLGTWVTSPNYRHPVPFAKDLMTLDDIADGRLLLGVGAGGLGWDAEVLGEPALGRRQRVSRLGEFVELLDLLLTQPVTDFAGEHYRAVVARMLPGPTQQPRPPFVVAANGPRSMAVAARYGQGWATTGPEGLDRDAWWRKVRELVDSWRAVLADHDREPAVVDSYLSVDGPDFTLSSVEYFADVVGQARELGFTDVVTHWPRNEGIYAGTEAVLEKVAGQLDELRA